VKWSVASGGNISYYTVQKSTDDINFETAGVVKASANIASTSNYSTIDEDPFQAFPISFTTNGNGWKNEQFKNSYSNPRIASGCVLQDIPKAIRSKRHYESLSEENEINSNIAVNNYDIMEEKFQEKNSRLQGSKLFNINASMISQTGLPPVIVSEASSNKILFRQKLMIRG